MVQTTVPGTRAGLQSGTEWLRVPCSVGGGAGVMPGRYSVPSPSMCPKTGQRKAGNADGEVAGGRWWWEMN